MVKGVNEQIELKETRGCNSPIFIGVENSGFGTITPTSQIVNI